VWRDAEPIQPIVGQPPLVNPAGDFAVTLTSYRDPRFLEPLGHRFEQRAPAGVVHGANVLVPGETAVRTPAAPEVKEPIRPLIAERSPIVPVQRAVEAGRPPEARVIPLARAEIRVEPQQGLATPIPAPAPPLTAPPTSPSAPPLTASPAPPPQPRVTVSRAVTTSAVAAQPPLSPAPAPQPPPEAGPGPVAAIVQRVTAAQSPPAPPVEAVPAIAPVSPPPDPPNLSDPPAPPDSQTPPVVRTAPVVTATALPVAEASPPTRQAPPAVAVAARPTAVVVVAQPITVSRSIAPPTPQAGPAPALASKSSVPQPLSQPVVQRVQTLDPPVMVSRSMTFPVVVAQQFPVLQREEALEPVQEPEATAAQPSPEPATPSAPQSSQPPPPPPPGPQEPEELLKTLFDPLLRRLRTELRLDRERRGVISDRW
jgi:hypothetical protein